MVRRSGFSLVVGLVMGLGLALSCGAENAVAPPALKQSNIQQCRSFELLMPNFVKAMETGQLKNLKTVIEGQLLKDDPRGYPAPINDVLRAVFATLNKIATKPPEPGQPAGQYCAPTASPPPIAQSNELCEIRRLLDTLVHQGKGIAAIALLEPTLLGIIDYITGKGKDGRAHYEVAQVLGGSCAQDANCRLENGLDLVIAFTAYSETPEGRLFVQHLNALADRPSIAGLLNPAALTEDGFVAIVKAMLPAIQNANANDLEAAFNALPLAQAVKDDFRPLLNDLKVLLNNQALIVPANKVINCFVVKDRNDDVARMLYRLIIRDALPAFSLSTVSSVFKGLQEVDARGGLIFLAGTLAKAVRQEEQAIQSAAVVCRTLLSTVPATGQTRSNAELILPSAAELIRQGIIPETICAIDTLIFGCAGGAQPACISTCLSADGGVGSRNDAGVCR